MNKFSAFIKIIGSLVFSYAIVMSMSPIVFKSINSPTLRENVPSYIASIVKDKINGFGVNQNLVKVNKTINERYMVLEKEAMQNIASGVRAREMDGVSEVFYDSKNMKWRKYTYKSKSGQVLTINVQEGLEPPPGSTPL
jgi:hypothetical protein